ncbi:hypothetical protein ANANG_G00165560 [Anguilla anguilla]|uniref:Mitochondrial import inner membrane translocase subunit Tim10 B n=1 Tax=Anguilla anguilla TaxID=7936 RepID=A0A9D3RVJ0_ANGAN|nr:hypothetical protein ANANG_G00165560 [Anguilla anguilla]
MEQDQQQLRNLRDFLLVYNRMTEICFQRCTSNLNYRNLTMDEERCVDSCAGKLIRTNHRLMGTYVQLMPGIVQRRLEEMEAKAGEMAKSAEAGAAVETVPTATAALPEGTVAESPSAFASTSVGLVGEIPPITAPPAALETVQLPPTLSQAPGEPAAVAVPAFSAQPRLSETLRTLPDLATAPPPIPPPETLPLPPRVDPPSAPGGAQSSPQPPFSSSVMGSDGDHDHAVLKRRPRLGGSVA